MLFKFDFVVCLIVLILMIIMDEVSELLSRHQALGAGVGVGGTFQKERLFTEIFHFKLKLEPFLIHLRNLKKTVYSCYGKTEVP